MTERRALQKPSRLQRGDRIATVSLSWGGAGDGEILWRYEQGKRRLEEQFGLEVVEMPHTLKGTKFVYEHPQKRAEDLMAAFADPLIKGIFACIGGDDSVRMLPYIDFGVIRDNPKVFLGYSDTTITHLICLKAGLSSFYGPSVLAEFAENVSMHPYTAHWVEKGLFNPEPIGPICAPESWTSERLPWLEENRDRARKMQPHSGYEVLQGSGVVRGRLIGGCVEVLEMVKQTELWPDASAWTNAILFLETSEGKPDPMYLEYWLRNYGTQGILQRLQGMIVGKPYDDQYFEEYKTSIRKILAEVDRSDLPVLYNMSFGHTAPMTILPMGALAEINCQEASFTILESGVV
ncbi:MAG TPA: S66 peptidase family protein [Limnochordia bacterium]|nr:S66 peptidase family protein [Limnochordia bacterium]